MATPHLCASCRHMRPVVTPRSVFQLCGRSQTEPARYPKYPRIPLLACRGYERRDGA
ncbi:MAG TPA: hypothetical protein VNZ52_09750 [Candidatus Thermoplasmatota archaeon]|nr:hypothetical protein [Candidatus Thermoplasmatota archaeon]